jgi:butyryl-CoA dehydrogenase
MAERFFSSRNLEFLLYEVLDVESLTQHEYYADHDRETFDLTLDTASQMASDMLHPYLGETDKEPPEYSNGSVSVHSAVREFLRACGEGGWVCATSPYHLGGQQLPTSIAAAVRFIFAAANYSMSVYPALTSSAGRLIESFGDAFLARTYLPKMYSGEWQGTMALTESQAGSSLSDVCTRATPTDDGCYLINGQKIFISAGDHDAVDNVVHFVLARIQGSPVGVKGISLFLVPKLRVADDDTLVPNDVHTVGIEHKMGYKGAPITQLSFGDDGDCRGYLVGEIDQGLFCMFQMMNEARIDVGMGAAAIASAAYHASLEYARERPQGRKPSAKDPNQPQVPIVEHADVKRMLLFQRSVVEGSLGLILQAAKYDDVKRVGGGAEKERAALLLDLLTPMAKSYPSEMGILSTSMGIQILGGYGYCDEYPLEQLYRDMRIHPIHEGTTGIHGLDMLNRKVRMREGKLFSLFLEETGAAVTEAREWDALVPYAGRLEDAVKTLSEVTGVLLQVAEDRGSEVFLADATLYLELFGVVAIGWQWLLQGIAVQKALAKNPGGAEANFYEGKWATLRYFFHYELPKIDGLARRLREADGLTVAVAAAHFDA